MKNFARLLALLLALITCVTLVVACDKGGEGEGGGEGESQVENEGYDINNRLEDSLPATLDFKGMEVNVLYWQDCENPEYEVETVTGDNVTDAIYDRNTQIEDRLGVEIVWYGQDGDGGDRTKFVQHVEAQYNTGTQMYDIISAYSRTMGTLAIQGYLYNLATITENNYIDLTKPWWPAQLVETVNFGDAYYFISGDMSTNVLYMMHMIYFNKDLYARHNIKAEDIYKLVYDGEWTLDKMIELTSNRYEDIDNTPGTSADDIYGFISLHYICDSFYPGSNLRLLDDHDEDMLRISADYGSAKTVKLINKLGQWAATDDVWIHNSFNEDMNTRKITQAAFSSGRAYMTLQHSVAGKGYASLNFDIGLCPVPKYNADQVNYYTGMGNPWSIYGIYEDFNERGDKNDTLSKLTAVLECWASEGFRLTTPEIFEVNMQLKYAEGQDETNMFEYIRSGITFDLGKIFAADLGNMCELPSNAICTNASWSSSYAAYKSSLGAQLEQIVKNFKQYQDERDR